MKESIKTQTSIPSFDLNPYQVLSFQPTKRSEMNLERQTTTEMLKGTKLTQNGSQNKLKSYY